MECFLSAVTQAALLLLGQTQINVNYSYYYFLSIGLTAVVASPSLVLNDVKGTACPGGDLEYTCTASFTTTFFSLRWIESNNLASQIIYLYNFPETLTNNSIAGFTTTVSIIPPDYTLTSTATLSRALLSHDNITLQCQLFTQSPVSEIVVTKGIVLKI